MADYHVLTGDKYENAMRVAFHIAVPDNTNTAGYSVRQAIVEFKGGASNIESAVPFIDAGELTQMQAGEIVEVVRDYQGYPSQTLVDRQTDLDALHPTVASETLADLQNILSYWGYSRVIP